MSERRTKVAMGAVAGTLGGPATYALELARALAADFPDVDLTVLTDRPEAFPAEIRTIHVPLGSAWEQPLWDHLRVGKLVRSGGFDLYHGTKGVLPRALGVPGVVTIHDLAVSVMPETFRLAQRVHLAFETRSTVRRARAVITDSESSAADIRRVYGTLARRIDVIPLAPPHAIRPASAADIEAWRRTRGIDGISVGYLGTIQPRKNLDALASAFLEAAAERPWNLLLAGRLRPGYRPACLDHADARIRYLGPLDDRELPLFLGTLSCMVSPSSYEGFGLSFIEAMAAGCPVIGLANSSVPEVVGDAGVLLEDLDGSRLAAAIRGLVTDPLAAARMRERGLARAAEFSWRETARRTVAVYRAVCEREAST